MSARPIRVVDPFAVFAQPIAAPPRQDIEWTKCPTCESNLWECPKCQLANPPGRKKCKDCGFWRVK